MEKTITITYRWWNAYDNKKKIRQAVQLVLDESAMSRILEQMNDGITSGELQDTVRMASSDGKNGIQYSGWFKITTNRNF